MEEIKKLDELIALQDGLSPEVIYVIGDLVEKINEIIDHLNSQDQEGEIRTERELTDEEIIRAVHLESPETKNTTLKVIRSEWQDSPYFQVVAEWDNYDLGYAYEYLYEDIVSILNGEKRVEDTPKRSRKALADKKILTFPNGSYIDFGSVERPENLEGFDMNNKVKSELLDTPEEWEELETAVSIFKNRFGEIDEIGFKVNGNRFVIKRDSPVDIQELKDFFSWKVDGADTEYWLKHKYQTDNNLLSKDLKQLLEKREDRAREEGVADVLRDIEMTLNSEETSATDETCLSKLLNWLVGKHLK